MVWDVIIIGAGPGGLQAGIAAGSEGLKVLIIEKGTVGGQIGQTPKLENSVFAAGGITGPDFAKMMREQALAMGVEFEAGTVDAVKRMANGKIRVFTNFRFIEGHTAIIAVGNKWREIDLEGMQEGLRNGHIHFGPVKSIDYKGKGNGVVVYGGGPSAGQAILALADNKSVSHVHAVMRSGLNMPEYLADRIRVHPRVALHEQQTLSATYWKGGRVFMVTTASAVQGGLSVEAEALFLCNGLLPDTQWVDVQKDSEGRILTGSHVGRSSLETETQGVYAIGDCRSGSTPRVGVAIGDGSMVVSEIWSYFRNNPVCHICPRLIGKRKS